MKHGLFVPAFTPDDVTLSVESWVLGTVLKEFGMRVVHADHNAEVLLDSRDEELKESPALILVSHFLSKLGKEGLKLFWCV